MYLASESWLNCCILGWNVRWEVQTNAFCWTLFVPLLWRVLLREEGMNIGTTELVKNIATQTVKSAITNKPIHTEDTILILTLQNTTLRHAIIHHPEATPPASPGSQIGLDLAHPCGTVLQMSKNTLTERKNDVTLFGEFVLGVHVCWTIILKLHFKNH